MHSPHSKIECGLDTDPIFHGIELTITLTQLEYVVAVARHRNFRAAAKSCNVTQPTLSMQIQKLEDHLDVVLFDRRSQPIRLTPIGQKIVEQSRVILSQANVIQDLIQQERKEVAGNLRLAVIPTLAPYVLPLFLDRFIKDNPQVELQVEESKTDDILAALAQDQIDVGLLVTPLGEEQIREYPLFSEPFYVYAAKSSPLCKLKRVEDSDLQDQELLLLAEGHCMREQMLRVCRHRRKRSTGSSRVHFESSSIETLCHLVEMGNGYTIIPHLATTWRQTPDAKVIPFSEPQPSREVSLVTHRGFVKGALLNALIDTITNSLPRELRNPDKELKTIKLR